MNYFIQFKNGRKFDYRHIITCAVSIVFVMLMIFVFPSSIGRLIESFKDLGLSFAFYFCKLFGIDNNIVPTVNNYPKMPFFEGFGENALQPSIALAEDWETFKADCIRYFELFIQKDIVFAYLKKLGDIAKYLCLGLLVVLPLIVIFYILFKQFMSKENNDYNKDSRPLIAYKVFSKKVCVPCKVWFSDYFAFLKEHKFYLYFWLFVWCVNFNVITIIIEFLAFYFYFVLTFDVKNIYKQFYKLILDLYVPFTVIPWFVWIVVAVLIFNVFRRSVGYNRLNHNELKNCGFINERPIVSMGVGSMGCGKTKMITDIVLSVESMFRDKAFEMILENDLKFPYFPWINLETELKKCIEHHTVYNLATCRDYMSKKRFRWEKKVCKEKIFGYDFERYGLVYDDKLKLINIWDVLSDYACLYFVYIAHTSLILSNYAIRSDAILSDLGNFPVWNSDFFKKDSRLIDAYSKHSHILDFDSIRLGKRLIENNKFQNSLDFGVIAITEIGKERGNAVELVDIKKKDEHTNQKNDLFNKSLKMIRHRATIGNYCFVKFLTDEQRPESWGADARDICEIIYVGENSGRKLTYPFFVYEEMVHDFVLSKFLKVYKEYRYLRGDNTLLLHFIKFIASSIERYYTHKYNIFGYEKVSVGVESGRMDGKMKSKTYYLASKKIYSKRYSTDCYSDYFHQKALSSSFGINDIPTYSSVKATVDELKQQNSYFIADLYSGDKEKEK